MPIKNGMETTLNIRELCKETAATPYIIGLTGDTSGNLDEECKAAGMDRIRIKLLITHD